jgi:hypothetical protein
MSSADGELFKDTFVIVSIDVHDVEDKDGGTKKEKEKKFDKGLCRLVVSSNICPGTFLGVAGLICY